ncbi:MAG: hypothetical protein ACQEXX_21370 [Bacillota bacterium]
MTACLTAPLIPRIAGQLPSCHPMRCIYQRLLACATRLLLSVFYMDIGNGSRKLIRSKKPALWPVHNTLCVCSVCPFASFPMIQSYTPETDTLTVERTDKEDL